MELTFNDYQDWSTATLIPPVIIDGPLMWSLGMAGEAGEAIEQVKRLYRDDDGIVTSERREKIKSELGDVLWYLSALAGSVDLSLQEVANYNLDKLAARLKQNKIKGEGDDR